MDYETGKVSEEIIISKEKQIEKELEPKIKPIEQELES